MDIDQAIVSRQLKQNRGFQLGQNVEQLREVLGNSLRVGFYWVSIGLKFRGKIGNGIGLVVKTWGLR